MAEKKPKVGDLVMHHGRIHEIVGLPMRAKMEGDKAIAVPMVEFENDSFKPLAKAADLRWSEEEGYWYLPGRVLAYDERAAVQAMSGSWPAPEAHLAMRSVLNVSGSFEDHLSLERLKGIINKNTRFPLHQEEGESDAAYDKRLTAYAKRSLEHCTQLRAFRTGEVKDVAFAAKGVNNG